MELAVEDSCNVPKDHIVSVRLGDVRRQASLAKLQQQNLKFPSDPGSVVEPMRIEVFRPVAAAHVVLQSQDKRYSVPLAEKGPAADAAMEIGFQIRAQNTGAGNGTGGTMAETGGSLPSQPEPTHGAKTQITTAGLFSETEDPDKYEETTQAAKRYLDSKGVMRYVQAMLHAVIQERPEDPYDFMRWQMQLVSEQRGDRAGQLEMGQLVAGTTESANTTLQPPEAARKKLHEDFQSASRNGDPEKPLKGLAGPKELKETTHQTPEVAGKQVLQDLHSACQNGKLENLLKGLPPQAQQQQQQQHQPGVPNETAPQKVETAMQQPMKNAPAVKAPQPPRPAQQEIEQPEMVLDEKQQQVEDSAFDQGRRLCRAKLNEAFQNGQLLGVLRGVLNKPRPRNAFEEARLLCKEKLYAAFENEELAKVVRSVLIKPKPENQISHAGAPPAPPHPDPPGPAPLGPEIQTPYAVGAIPAPTPIIEDLTAPPPLGYPTPPGGGMPMQPPPAPEGPPPTLPPVSMGARLPEEVEQARIRLQNLLQSALQGGTLETAIRELLGSEARIRLQNQLQSALQSGMLETAIRELLQSEARIRLQNQLQSALQSGMLETAVRELLESEAGGHGPVVSAAGAHGPFVSEAGAHRPFVNEAGGHRPAPDLANLEAVRAKETIRRVLEDGLQDGRLDGVLDNLRGERIRGVASPEIKAARDRMLQVLETAVDNGSLKSALDDIFGQDNAVGMEQQHGAAVTGGPNVPAETPPPLSKPKPIPAPAQPCRSQAQAQPKPCRAVALSDRLEDTRKTLHSDLQSATRTGGLQEALETAIAKGDAPASCRSGPPEQRTAVRRSHTQDIGSLRDQLKNLKTENETLREKVSKLENAMQRAEERRRREEILLLT